MDFENKVVLITGASAGIGKTTAILFAARGAQLALVGRNADNLRAVAATCAKQHNVQPLEIVADLATDEGCERTAKETLKHFGRLDVLINNAGVGARANLENTDMATYDRVFNLDVRGVYNLTRLVAPALIAAKGNIVNISSIAATMVAVGNLPYSMAKAAVDHFTRLTALELAPKGVRVNAVSPGVTVSDFLLRLTDYDDAQYDAWLKAFEKDIPMGRVCAAEDVAKTIVFLASADAQLVTGTIVKVDGGLGLAGLNSNNLTQPIKKYDFVKRITDIDDAQYVAWLKNFEKDIPMGRVCAAEDVAKTVVFLASGDAQLVTGTIVKVDGGLDLAGTNSNNVTQIKK